MEPVGRRAYTLAGFRRFASELTLDTGGRFHLEPHEEPALADHFAGVTEVVDLESKKNGKTTRMGALGLYHIAQIAEADCVIGAASRDQATIVFNQAAGIVRRSGLDHKFRVLPGYRRIEYGFSKLRVLAADATTSDGVIPTLAIVDELHRHPSGALYGVFRDGLAPRGGQMFTISTAGSSIDSPLGELRAKAHLMEGFSRDPATKYAHVRSPDGAFAFHEWALEAEDDVDDMEVVKLVNPASWHTIKKLQERHDSPSMTPSQWLRFACGIWTEAEEPWIEPASWDRCASPGLEIGRDDEVHLGIDLGVAYDSTAVVLASATGGKVKVKARILNPPAKGKVAIEAVEDQIREVCSDYRVVRACYDPWGFRRSAELLEAEGLPMEAIPQTPERMAVASATLYRLVDSQQLSHDGDRELRAHVLAGVAKETGRGWRLDRERKGRRRPIDALIAMAMAVQSAAEPAPSMEPLVRWGS